MGSSQSQEERTVTVESSADDGGSQFVVTESFVSYLKDKVTPEGKEEEDEEDEEDNAEEDDIPTVNAESITAPLRGEQRSSRSSARGTDPQGDVGGAPSTESLHWKEKFEMEKAKNEVMKSVTSREFDTIVGEVREKLNKQVPQLVSACEEFKEKVSDCYLSNPGRPLACRAEVKAYMSCVHRIQRGEQPTATTSAASTTADTQQQHVAAPLPETQ